MRKKEPYRPLVVTGLLLALVLAPTMLFLRVPDTRAASGDHLWSKHFDGGSAEQYGYSVAVDAPGNVFLTGYFNGSVNFGGGTLSANGFDIFLAKFDASGNHLWSKRFGDANNQLAYAVAVDAVGNVLITGYFNGAVDFGGGPLTSTGGTDIFLAKFDASGNHLWSRRFGDGTNEHRGNGVVIDSSGDVLLTGDLKGSVDFGGGQLSSAGNWDIFLAKFDSFGNHLWSKRFGDANGQIGQSVAVDGTGNVLVTGNFSGSVDFGGGVLTSAGAADIFVAKFDPSGNHLWSKRFGDADYQYGWSIASDASGNVLVTGHFFSSVDFGGGVLTSAGGWDIFLAKFDALGNHLWSKRFGDGDHQQAFGLAVDRAGSVFITGTFNSSVDFGGGTLTSAGGGDIFLAKFSSAGTHLWSKRFGGTGAQTGYSVAVDSMGSVLLTGFFMNLVDFGGGPFTANNQNIFLAKFAGIQSVGGVSEQPQISPPPSTATSQSGDGGLVHILGGALIGVLAVTLVVAWLCRRAANGRPPRFP